MDISPDQVRAARALKGWSQGQLATLCSVTTATIANIELGKQRPSWKTMQSIRYVFERNGIVFTDYDGVQKRASHIRSYHGQEGFFEFFNHVDQVAMDHPDSEFLVSHVNEKEFLKWQGGPLREAHEEAILEANVRYRILLCEGDTLRPAQDYAHYRQVPQSLFFSVPYYVYGDHVAIISFERSTVSVFVIQHKPIVTLYRKQFEELWQQSSAIS